MKRGFILKIRNLLKSVEFGKDSVNIIIEAVRLADKKKLDPFKFDLQNSVLIPLEDKLFFNFNQMRKIIDKDIMNNWESHKNVYKQCGFDSKPTVKGLFSCIMLKLREE